MNIQTSRILMLPRELLFSYLPVAYSKRFQPLSSNHFHNLLKIKEIAGNYLTLIRELLRPTFVSFDTQATNLSDSFQHIQPSTDSSKPICAYFVSSQDTNGAILSTPLYYYHHYKIQKFQQHFDVSAKVVFDDGEIEQHLQTLQTQYPGRQIQVVDIVAHGDSCSIKIPDKQTFTKNGGFSPCAEDAVIILDACSTGKGDDSIAKQIAENNPGKTVIAPGTSLYFSKPVINRGRVTDWVHGFAIFLAYVGKKFFVPVES